MTRTILVAFLTVFLAGAGPRSRTLYPTDPKTEAAIIAAGVNSTFLIGIEGGGIVDVKVKSIEKLANGHIKVETDPVDKFVYFQDDVPVTYKRSDGDDPGSGKGQLILGSKADYSAGLASGAIGAAQLFIASDSSEAKSIRAAYSRIRSLQSAMVRDLDKIESMRIDIETGIIDIQTKIDRSSGAKDLGVSANFNDKAIGNILNSSDRDLTNYSFLSSNRDFIFRAKQIKSDILSVPNPDRTKRSFKDIAKVALVGADRSSFIGDDQQAEYLIGIARLAADVVVGMDPYTGLARSLYETVTGKNLVTQVDLTQGERVLAAAGIITFGYVTEAWRAYKYLMPMASKIAPTSMKTYGAIRNFLSRTGNGFELVGKGSVVRKINFNPVGKNKEKWGLTKRHLGRHFFDTESRISLKNVDPGGNVDTWMHNIMDLAQSPVTARSREGILDVVKTFKRSDNSGVYEMGLRLSPAENGSFDLVTVLTDPIKFR